MKEEVYEYLHDYGFSSIDLDKIEDENEEMYFTSIKEIKKNITFLEEKYLESGDIINVINNNPFMLTEKNNRLESLDNIYSGVLGIDYESMKELIKNNPETYTISPVELQGIIDYMKELGYNKEIIREFILKNNKVINMTAENFKKVLKIQ